MFAQLFNCSIVHAAQENATFKPHMRWGHYKISAHSVFSGVLVLPPLPTSSIQKQINVCLWTKFKILSKIVHGSVCGAQLAKTIHRQYSSCSNKTESSRVGIYSSSWRNGYWTFQWLFSQREACSVLLVCTKVYSSIIVLVMHWYWPAVISE